MYSFAVPDVNEALQYGIEYLLREGIEEQSRFGPVLAAPGPVCVEYLNPRQRVLYSSARDANPVFHFFESLWMLSGCNDIEFPCFFSKNYGQFSDDGKTMWDAYGWRWRSFFGWDQLEAIVEELRANPNSRRCVLSMWNGMPTILCERDGPVEDKLHDFHVATHGGKAVPCNTHAYFAIRGGRLNMTVCNRSNDALWGAFGANAVHFSFLLEYLAMRIGVLIGSYWQFTNNLHVYTNTFSLEKLDQIKYECDTLGPSPELGPALAPGFDKDLQVFMQWARRVIGDLSVAALLDVPDLKTEFMQSVAVPMFLFWSYRKLGDAYSSSVCLDGIDAPDWHKAVSEWVDRRKK